MPMGHGGEFGYEPTWSVPVSVAARIGRDAIAQLAIVSSPKRLQRRLRAVWKYISRSFASLTPEINAARLIQRHNVNRHDCDPVHERECFSVGANDLAAACIYWLAPIRVKQASCNSRRAFDLVAGRVSYCLSNLENCREYFLRKFRLHDRRHGDVHRLFTLASCAGRDSTSEPAKNCCASLQSISPRPVFRPQ